MLLSMTMVLPHRGRFRHSASGLRAKRKSAAVYTGIVSGLPTILSERRSTCFGGSAVIRQLAALLSIGKR
jgi:hypothetical protein